MTPDFLVDRKVVMGALGIKTEVEFHKMLKEGLIPPAVGQFKSTHLWSNSIVQTFRKYAQELGVKGSHEWPRPLEWCKSRGPIPLIRV